MLHAPRRVAPRGDAGALACRAPGLRAPAGAGLGSAPIAAYGSGRAAASGLSVAARAGGAPATDPTARVPAAKDPTAGGATASQDPTAAVPNAAEAFGRSDERLPLVQCLELTRSPCFKAQAFIISVILVHREIV